MAHSLSSAKSFYAGEDLIGKCGQVVRLVADSQTDPPAVVLADAGEQALGILVSITQNVIGGDPHDRNLTSENYLCGVESSPHSIVLQTAAADGAITPGMTIAVSAPGEVAAAASGNFPIGFATSRSVGGCVTVNFQPSSIALA